LYATEGRWEEFEAELAELRADGNPTARLQADTTGAMRQLLFGRRAAAEAALEEAASEALSRGDLNGAAQLANLHVGVAMQFEEPETALQLNRELEAIDDPTGTWEQAILSNDLVANAMLGRTEQAYAMRDGLWDQLSGLPIPDLMRSRLRHQIDGALAWAARDLATAVEELRAAVALMPPSPMADGWTDIHYFLATSLRELGRPDEAAAVFRRIADIGFERMSAPVYWVESHWYLGDYHAQRGETEPARRYYELFLEYWGDGEVGRDKVARAREYLR
jgi:tetratricopeptide (TPR) repeat protein